MANLIYNQAKGRLGDGTINWTSAQLWVALLKTGHSYGPNIDDDFLSTPIATAYAGNEYANSLGYVRKQLITPVVTIDDANDRAAYDAADITWTAINVGGVAAAILFLRVGADFTTPGDDILLAFYDFVATTNGGDLTLQWSTSPSACLTIT